MQDASVLGKSFSIAGLVATTGRPADELEPLLASLVRKEVVAQTADPMSPERGQGCGVLALMVLVLTGYIILQKVDDKPRAWPADGQS